MKGFDVNWRGLVKQAVVILAVMALANRVPVVTAIVYPAR